MNAHDLAARLASLLRNERHAMADFLVALSEFDDRKAWMKLGHASLFTFLHRDLGLSKGASHFRKVAAELIQRYPEVVEPLRDGRLCITSVVELAKVITPENRAAVLPRFFHASKQEAKAVAAENPASRGGTAARGGDDDSCPRRTRDGLARRHDEGAGFGAGCGAAGWRRSSSSRTAAVFPASAASAHERPAAHRRGAPAAYDGLEALPGEVGGRSRGALALASGRRRRGNPGGGAGPPHRAGREEEGAQHEARRRARGRRPSGPMRNQETSSAEAAPTPDAPRPRYIPADVRREVWLRDEGRCQFRLESGEICGSTHRLQFDHIHPFALGGESTVSNIRSCLCRPQPARGAANLRRRAHGSIRAGPAVADACRVTLTAVVTA